MEITETGINLWNYPSINYYSTNEVRRKFDKFNIFFSYYFIIFIYLLFTLTVLKLLINEFYYISMSQDFVTGLSILSRGSMDEKLRWTFSLYDINGDGCITREEMTDIVTAVYELMGKFADPNLNHEGVREKVDRMFQVRFLFYQLP